MKNTFALLCGTIALLCLFSMFVPIVAPHYSSQLYHPSSEASYARDYFLDGDYYQARQYWSITVFALTNTGHFHRIVLSVDLALVLYWCTMSFMGEKAILAGLISSFFNLAVVLYSVVRMLSMAGASRTFVIAVVILDSLLAVVCSVFAALPGRRARYTKPIKVRIGKN